RRVAPAAAASVGWLGGRAAERRHREALVALRAVAVWADLPPARLLEVADAMRALDVAAGEEVIRQGEPGDCLYLIGRGAVEVVVDGQPQTRLGPGEYFGERALLQPVARAATVVALEPTRLFVLDRVAFESLLASDLAVRARLENALAYRQTIADMPLFAGLSSAELDLLLARLIPVSVAADQVVIQQGESGERFYVVRSGAVEVERDGTVLARLGPGEAFGEIALLLDVPRTATVSAAEASELLALEAHDFRDLLARYLDRAGELEQLSHLRLNTHKRLDEVV
ncbi:MAG TPA: cyclic nucleotide-binding domain-containing protein, partial [Chloroflexota bacterium]|nr:cyclic nucleotide-binding domain-containing protein [Chloroflexota bacterium]